MKTLINNNILITDRKVDKIIKVDNSIVYYLSNDKLYYFSFYTGEKQMIEYYELSFNKGTTIYIY